MKAIIAGPLLDQENRKLGLYELISNLCNKLQIETFVPHLHTEPIDKPAKPSLVFKQDFEGLKSCHLLIAEVTTPSHGVGCELMQAFYQKIPIICIVKKNTKISRMVRGNPYIKIIIEYKNDEDCLIQLGEALKRIITSLSESF